mmetsp:Transcript_2807/g.4055  ORF Transcript_2807/g.4055 Transcript_2807/m.4055 type:complete len:753 (-) Transcript_2807:377-2635(-)|eukprot:CAMPEP_0203748400 /NCGR_PEP_ID=MMETSP0098-20131031/3288_1 /ASSEMBLY_ACC=CAM_ASM_000208 /TAXON_ID=96639 /ORGANISM=" , Strain NY0313808BC1" /LENGTH=752 /DNA_ID=CAMNT_0050637127 /DNA_START=220 /DNA_END=2478 /DNA_ORIENTATION=-
MGAGPSAHVETKAPVFTEDEYSDYSDGKPKYVMFKDDVSHVRFAKKGAGANGADGGAPSVTMIEAFQMAVKKWGDKPAIRVERPVPSAGSGEVPPSAPAEEWKTWTFKEYYEECRRAAKGYMKLGAVRYDGVNILGFNSPEWFMGEMSSMMIGGKVAGIYPTDTPEQVQYKTALADGSIALVDSKANLEKFASVVDQLPYLKAIITWDYADGNDIKRSDGTVVRVLTWQQLLELGDQGDDKALDALIKATQPNNVCALVFTSGTTGNPKAVMVSHDSMVFQGYTVFNKCMPGFAGEETQERILSYLPLSHVAGSLLDIIGPIAATGFSKGWVTVHIARPYDLKMGSLGQRIAAVRPTIFLGVPRVWEKISEKMKAVGATVTGLKKQISTWAKGVSLDHQVACQVGGDGSKRYGYGIANILLAKIKDKLGLDQCRYFFTSAAPISKDTLLYFASIGIPILEVYGMSECTGASTWATSECHTFGTVGYEMHGCEVKIFDFASDGSKKECPISENPECPTEAEQGEICFRGRHVMMGYLANPNLGEEHVEEIRNKNKEVIDNEGWLHSGDKGSKDSTGMIRITGRYKEIIITAGGENIAPVNIENTFKQNCPIVSNIMMIGDRRKFNVCLITLKAFGATLEKPGTDQLDGPAATLVSGVTSIPEAVQNEVFIKTITDALTKTNNDGTCCPSNASKIQKFTILPLDFSVETGEYTPSLKLRRSVVDKKFKNIIDKMYTSKDTYVPYALAHCDEDQH